MKMDMKIFTELFQGNPHSHGRMDDNGRIWTEKRGVTTQDIEAHIKGAGHRIGIIPLVDGKCCWAMIDIDVDVSDGPTQEKVLQFINRATHYKISVYPCSSKRNRFHLVCFFSDWIEASKIRRVLSFVRDEVELKTCDSGGGIYPKQDNAKTGNFIFLPFYNLNNNNQTDVLLNWKDSFKPFSGQWSFLGKIEKIETEVIDEVIELNNIEPESAHKTPSYNDNEYTTGDLPFVKQPIRAIYLKCKAVRDLRDKAIRDKHLTHDERIYFANVFASITSGLDEIHRVFSYLNDYNAEITSQQIASLLKKGTLCATLCQRQCPNIIQRVGNSPIAFAYKRKTKWNDELNFKNEWFPFRLIEATKHCVLLEANAIRFKIERIIIKDSGAHASIEVLREGKLVSKDKVNFDKSSSRRAFANEICNNTQDVDCAIIELLLLELSRHLLKCKVTIEDLNAKLEDDNQIQLTDSDIKAAIDRLNSPVLLYDIACVIKTLGVAGNLLTPLVIYLTFISRHLKCPLSLLIKGTSASGKSYQINKVKRLIPSDGYIELTDATTQSFYYLPDGALKHRIVIISEIHGVQKANYPIRILQSEHIITIQVTVKNSQTGKYETETKKQEGPVGFINTTTYTLISHENETRALSLYTDETAQQTKLIFQETAKRYTDEWYEVAEEECVRWQHIDTQLQEYRVIIPYGKYLTEKFPSHVVRARRDFQRLLAFVETCAILHQHQRKCSTSGSLIATLADYYIAKKLASVAFVDTLLGISPISRTVIGVAKEYAEKNNDHDFTGRDLESHKGTCRCSCDIRSIQRALKQAVSAGYIELVEEHRGSKAARFKFIKEPEEIETLPSVEEVALFVGRENLLKEPDVYDPITGEFWPAISFLKRDDVVVAEKNEEYHQDKGTTVRQEPLEEDFSLDDVGENNNSLSNESYCRTDNLPKNNENDCDNEEDPSFGDSEE